MLRLAHIMERICTYAARVAGLLLFALTAVILYEIIGRQFYNTNSVALGELQWHLHGVIALLGFGYAYTRDAHVRIDLVSQNFSQPFRMKLEILGIVLFMTPFMILIIQHGSDFAYRSYIRSEGSNGGLGLDHRFIIKSIIPISAILALMGAYSVVLRMIVVLRGNLKDPYESKELWKS